MNVLVVESTNKGVNLRSKYVTYVQQQRPESPTVTLTWHACKYKVHTFQQRYIFILYLKEEMCVCVGGGGGSGGGGVQEEELMLYQHHACACAIRISSSASRERN